MSEQSIALIAPPSSSVDDDAVDPPLGLLYIAAVLIEQNFEDIQVVDLTGRGLCLQEIDQVELPQSDIYGISCFCTNYVFVKQIIQRLKEINPEAMIVLGGPNPSALPQYTMEDSGADAVVVGEGEDAFASIVRALASGQRLEGVITGTGRENLDAYPFPARQLVNLTHYSRKLEGRPCLSILGSRGCSHHCVHCNSVVLGGGSPKVRYRSAENICAEISLFRDRYSHFRFTDDHFTGHPELLTVLEQIKKLDIRFRAFACIEDLTEERSKALHSSGCCHVTVGIESLNVDNLRIIGKIRQARCFNNIETARKAGLAVRASFMVGLPFDSDASVSASFYRAAQLGIDEFAVYPIIPYPGTLIAKHPERYGYTVVNQDFTSYVQIGRQHSTCYALKHKNFSTNDVKRWLQAAETILKQGGARHMRNSQLAC